MNGSRRGSHLSVQPPRYVAEVIRPDVSTPSSGGTCGVRWVKEMWRGREASSELERET